MDATAAEQFATLLTDLADEGPGTDLTVEDAAERGWMVPEGQSLVVTDQTTGETFLVTVQQVS